VSGSLQEGVQKKALFSLGELFLCKQEGPLASIWRLSEEAELSSWLHITQVQDAFCFRAKRRALLTADYVLDDIGELQVDRLQYIEELLYKEGYITYIEGRSDRVITEHILASCKAWREDKSLRDSLRSFHSPVCHALAEEMLRDVLGLSLTERLTDRHIRLAVLSACWTPLRQNVGSCFATAPAILIQRERVHDLVKDLHELLMTGKLKRTFGGTEWSVPLSPTSGIGDLGKTVDLSALLQGAIPPLGLVMALEAVEVIASQESPSLEARSQYVRALVHALPSKLGNMRIIDLLHSLLLVHLELSEQDLLLYEKNQRSLAKSQGAFGSVAGVLSSHKMKSCEQLKQAEKRARAVFKGITDHALLKGWEFTLASFSESKTDFAAWNLCVSLGLDPEEKGGIGAILREILQKKLDESNHKMLEYQEQYSIAYDQLRATEALLQQASTESDIRRLKAEHATRLVHLQSCQAFRDECHEEATQIASFLPFLIKQYQEKFLEYFQEIYDAQMLDVEPSLYEDSPAGFRLVYKHGRSNASLWTLIYTEEQFVDILTDFFVMIEPQVAATCEWKGGEKTVELVTTTLVNHLRTQEFMQTAYFRLKKAHSQISGLELGEKKPWAYTSGGNMVALLKIYYRREGEISEEKKWVEDPTHLLTFLLDTLKTLPMQEEMHIVQGNRALLMNSPTHAFLFYPSWPKVREGWQDPLYTYSWIRDHIILPSKQFYESMRLSPQEQLFLVEELLKKLPVTLAQKVQKGISFSQEATLQEWREQVVQALPLLEERVDGLLYESTPLISGREWKHYIRNLLIEKVEKEALEQTLQQEPEVLSSFLTSKELQDIAKIVFFASTNQTNLSFDLHEYIAKRAREQKLMPPEPFFFADTNWMGYDFSFLVSPSTSKLELWRLDKSGGTGFPMTSWKGCFDGSKEVFWRVFAKPSQYA